MSISRKFSGRMMGGSELVTVRKVFLMALSVGVMGIIFGILFVETSVFAALVPLVAMIGYCYFTQTHHGDLPRSTIADSYYYLGFIFTLVSLVCSLFHLGQHQEININTIVGSFGAALVTTIVGLIMRLFVVTFSFSVAKRNEYLEQEIEQSLLKFSGQMDVLINQVVSSVAEVHAKTSAVMDETIENYQTLNDLIENDLKLSLKNGQKSIGSAMENLRSKIEEIEVKPLYKSLEGHATSIDNIICKMDAHVQLSSQHYQDADKQAQTYVQSLEKFESLQVSQLETLSGHLQAFEQSLDGLATNIKLHSDTLDARIDVAIKRADAQPEWITLLCEFADDFEALTAQIDGLKAEHWDASGRAKLRASILTLTEKVRFLTERSLTYFKKAS